MGISEDSQKMVAASDNHYAAAIGALDNIYRVECRCTVYLYAVLTETTSKVANLATLEVDTVLKRVSR